MFVSFSTTCASNAQSFLAKDEYKWLNEAQKEFIVKNINEGIRVQDPLMYPKPSIEFHGSKSIKLKVELDILGGSTKEEIQTNTMWTAKYNLSKMFESFTYGDKSLIYLCDSSYYKETFVTLFDDKFSCDSITKRKVISLLVKMKKKLPAMSDTNSDLTVFKNTIDAAEIELASFIAKQKVKYSYKSFYCQTSFFKELKEQVASFESYRGDVLAKEAELEALLSTIK